MDKSTQAEQKLIVQFQNWFETNGIEAKALKLRRKLGIPPEGIPITERDRKLLGLFSLLPEKIAEKDVGKRLVLIRGAYVGTRELLENSLPVLGHCTFSRSTRLQNLRAF